MSNTLAMRDLAQRIFQSDTWTPESPKMAITRALVAPAFVMCICFLLTVLYRLHGPTRTASNLIVDLDAPRLQGSLEGLQTTGYAGLGRTNLTKLLVIPCTVDDDVSWLDEELPQLSTVVYRADNDTADLHPPRNKGHEVMIYFTYIIDHYNDIPSDIVIFMHAHHFAQHNNDFLNFDAAQMIQQLRVDHVIRQGYFNMRCHWSPGCPTWLDPKSERDELSRQEEVVLSQSWSELFPNHSVPSTLAQACCAQFAVSRDTIHSIPRSRFIYYRDWILKTPLSSYIAGRLWEYSWQYLFAEHGTFCPAEHACYCDGYGMCFGGEEGYEAYKRTQPSKQDKRRLLD